jgi:hypothetical protein
MNKGSLETYSNFAFRLSLPFNSWLDGEGAGKDVEKLKEVMKLEQFVNCLPTEIHRWVIEKKPETLAEAAKLADEFAILYKPFKMEKYGGSNFEAKKDWGQDRGNWAQEHSFSSADKRNWATDRNSNWSDRGKGTRSPKFNSGGTKSSSFPKSFGKPPSCKFCGKIGHVLSQCWQFKDKQETGEPRNWETTPKTVELVTGEMSHGIENQVSSQVHDRYKPFCSEAWLYTNEGARRRKIVMLRDSGCLQSLVSAEKLNENEYTDTREKRLIQGIVGEPVEIPLVEVAMDSVGVRGKVLCGLVEKLPRGVEFLWGNDIPQEGVVDVSVVTRAQTKAAKVNEQGNNDVVCAQVCEEEVVDCDEDMFTGVHALFEQPSDILSHIGSIVKRDEFITLQQQDNSLSLLMDLAKSGQNKDERSFYSMQNDVLVRHWRDKFTPEGLEVKQVVVPARLRRKLLTVAHDIPSSGHLGTQKTTDRLLRHFWWPRIFGDIKEYCRSCVICQKLGRVQ